ncbi:MAG: hypothetical protein ACRCTE_14355 [Cellulosilyticaceae bacterium]
MKFDICLVRNKIVSEYNIEDLLSKSEYLRSIMEKEYDCELDDETSVIFDICCIFDEIDLINFKVSGFGESCWGVDCRYDLSSIIADIHNDVVDKILHNIYNFQLRFDEQGIQRYINVKSEEQKVVLTCHTYTEWKPSPQTIEIEKEEFKDKIIMLYNDFIEYANEICPALINHGMLSRWKKI